MSMIQMLTSMSGRVVQIINIVNDTRDYVLNTSKVGNYIAGQMDVILIISAGIYIGSNTIGAGLIVDNSWHQHDTVTIINNGYILGKGGNGGSAGSTAPTSGGLALQVLRTVKITNNGIIGGGGGGGGGGAGNVVAFVFTKVTYYLYAGGGGGNAGAGYSTGGIGSSGYNSESGWGWGNYNISPTSGNTSTRLSSSATTSSGGVMGNNVYGNSYGSPGGLGGNLGAAGSDGSAVNGAGWYGRQLGAAPGACVSGNSYITWINTGTRYGTIG